MVIPNPDFHHSWGVMTGFWAFDRNSRLQTQNKLSTASDLRKPIILGNNARYKLSVNSTHAVTCDYCTFLAIVATLIVKVFRCFSIIVKGCWWLATAFPYQALKGDSHQLARIPSRLATALYLSNKLIDPINRALDALLYGEAFGLRGI